MMSRTLIVLGVLVACACALEYKSVDYYAYPKYEFKYGVEDPKTGDLKERAELRDGELVKQEYSWAEKDREVKVSKIDDKGVPVEIAYKGY